MLVKIIIFVMIALILASLGSGLYHLLSGKPLSDAVAKALTIRMGLSLLLFILLLVGFGLGFVNPRGA